MLRLIEEFLFFLMISLNSVSGRSFVNYENLTFLKDYQDKFVHRLL